MRGYLFKTTKTDSGTQVEIEVKFDKSIGKSWVARITDFDSSRQYPIGREFLNGKRGTDDFYTTFTHTLSNGLYEASVLPLGEGPTRILFIVQDGAYELVETTGAKETREFIQQYFSAFPGEEILG